MYSEILYIFGPSVSTNEKFLGKGAISVMAFSRNTAIDGSTFAYSYWIFSLLGCYFFASQQLNLSRNDTRGMIWNDK